MCVVEGSPSPSRDLWNMGRLNSFRKEDRVSIDRLCLEESGKDGRLKRQDMKTSTLLESHLVRPKNGSEK